MQNNQFLTKSPVELKGNSNALPKLTPQNPSWEPPWNLWAWEEDSTKQKIRIQLSIVPLLIYINMRPYNV